MNALASKTSPVATLSGYLPPSRKVNDQEASPATHHAEGGV